MDAAPRPVNKGFRALTVNFTRDSPELGIVAQKMDAALASHTAQHDAPRAGYHEPYTIAPGIDTIAVPDFDVDLLGHGYFAKAEALLYDMFELIREGTPPPARQRVDAIAYEGSSIWKLRR